MKRQWILCTVIVFMFSCSSKKEDTSENISEITFTVEHAPKWTDLFKRSNGWFGGDGIFAIPFSGSDVAVDDSVLFLFSDTMVGEIVDGKLQSGFKMVNNSVMILKGEEPVEEKSQFLVKETSAKEPATLFIPNTPATKKGDYYWLGDGFVNHADKDLHIFAYRIRNTDDGSDFPFKEVGNALLVIPNGEKFPFENYRQVELPFSQESDSIQISFGLRC